MERIPVQPQHNTISDACIRLVESAAEFFRDAARPALGRVWQKVLGGGFCYKFVTKAVWACQFSPPSGWRENGLCHDEAFPLPWCVEAERGGCFVMRDRNEQALSNVYFEDESKRHLFTRNRA
jgi:hypothetical protein